MAAGELKSILAGTLALAFRYQGRQHTCRFYTKTAASGSPPSCRCVCQTVFSGCYFKISNGPASPETSGKKFSSATSLDFEIFRNPVSRLPQKKFWALWALRPGILPLIVTDWSLQSDQLSLIKKNTSVENSKENGDLWLPLAWHKHCLVSCRLSFCVGGGV